MKSGVIVHCGQQLDGCHVLWCSYFRTKYIGSMIL